MPPAAVRRLTAALALVAGACGFPGDAEVRARFEREHPTYEVVGVGPGEGDGSAVYYHIRYRRPGDSRVHEDVWLYLDRGDGRKVLTHRETLPARTPLPRADSAKNRTSPPAP